MEIGVIFILFAQLCVRAHLRTARHAYNNVRHRRSLRRRYQHSHHEHLSMMNTTQH